MSDNITPIDTDVCQVTFDKKEYSIVGDAFYPTINAEMPQWLLDLINQYITNTNQSTYNNLNQYSTALLAALESLNISKNTYEHYISKVITDQSAYVASLITLNASIANSDASIRQLLSTYATQDYANSTAAQLLTASINGGAIGAKIGTVETAMATQYGALAQRLNVLEATYTDSINDLYGKAQVIEAVNAYVGRLDDGSTTSLSYKITLLKDYLTDPDTGDLYGDVNQNLGGYTEVTAKRLADNSVEVAVADLYSKYSKITVGDKSYINGFGLFANYNGTTGGKSTFWAAADEFKLYDASTLSVDDIQTKTVLSKEGVPVEVVTGISGGVSPFKIENGVTYIQNAVIGYDKVTGTPTHDSGSLLDRPQSAVEGSTYTDTSVTPNVIYIYTSLGWSTANQGQFKSIVFKRSSTVPYPPTDGSYSSPVPTGWSDGIPAEDGNPCYYSVRTFTVNGGAPQDASWSTPVMLSNTADTKYVYSNSATQPTLSGTGPTTPSGWSATASVDAVWAAISTMSNGAWTSWSAYKVKGENGNDGNDGNDGSRGATTTSITTTTALSSYSSWDADFNTAIGNTGVRIKGDTLIVTSTHSTGGGTTTYVRNDNEGTLWTNYAWVVHGNALINGSLSVEKVTSGSAYIATGQKFALAGTSSVKNSSGSILNAAVIGEDTTLTGIANGSVFHSNNNTGVVGGCYSTGYAAGAFYRSSNPINYSTLSKAAILCTNNYAGEFTGDVTINGNLSVSGMVTNKVTFSFDATTKTLTITG